MSKRIAVLSFNFISTREWIEKEFQISMSMLASKKFVLANSDELYIISCEQDAAGMTFDDYRIAPDYNHLEDYIRTLIRE